MSSLREQDDDWDDRDAEWDADDEEYAGEQEGWDEPGERACPRCGEMISEDAPKCPHCGDWILDEDESEAARRSRGMLWPIVVAILVVTLAMWMVLR